MPNDTMTIAKTAVRRAALILMAGMAIAAQAADDDALDLKADDPPQAAASTAADLRLMLEVAAQFAERQAGLGSEDGRRVSLDLRWTRKLSDGWRLGLSDRLDDQHPVLAGRRSTRNSLREAYAGWQDAGGRRTLDAGRINLRHGPAYGYNPTDYFRSGATRSVITADPVAIRENRVGTFMLRGTQQWDAVGVAVTWAPRLTRNGPSDEALTLDLGSTNAHNRVLLSVNGRPSQRWSGEALVLHDGDTGTRLGANLTGLLTDAAVLHAEWSTLRSAGLLAQTLGTAVPRRREHQASLGMTWTLPGGLAVTAEAEYNGAGLNRAGWQTLYQQGPAAIGQLFSSTQGDQELASRRAWLLYATQKSAFFKQLDLTGFIRQSVVDHSYLAWAELRYHWPRFDAALQWQASSHRMLTEYGALPYRQVIQLLGNVYF